MSQTLSARELPEDALYGLATLRGAENFNISGRVLRDEDAFVRAIAQIKLAAARANAELGVIAPEQARAIEAACVEIIAGSHSEHFIVNMYEGSGGTSINMNLNEVIANRGLQIMDHQIGDYAHLHPNDHVNAGQSTNDVIPSALKLAVIEKSAASVAAIDHLACAFQRKSEDFADVLKVGRTCMQAAQPMTLGQEFGGYASALRRAAERIVATVQELCVLPLGGTAIGTGLGAHPGFQDAVFAKLSRRLDLAVRPAVNRFDAMQNTDGIARVSAEFRITAELIGKMCMDLVILSSGTKSGIGEIRLPAVQAGSSIMPGKVNPVLPMMMQQIAFAAHGNDAVISLASLNGQLEINHFEPVMALRLFETIDLLTNGCRKFADLCVSGIVANEDQAFENLIGSSALATVLLPKLGYAEVSRIAHEAEDQGVVFPDELIRRGLIQREEIRSALYSAANANSV